MVQDILQRYAALRDALPALRLYALVDGAQYQMRRTQSLEQKLGRRPLFAGTDDAPLANYGPWLIDALESEEGDLGDISLLEQEAPAVSWLLTPVDPEGLAQLLQLRMDAVLPDGRTALLRFWDPRVLGNLAEIMDANQRSEFFAHILEWHFLRQDRRVWIGRHNADAE
jgi:hypothetical protein